MSFGGFAWGAIGRGRTQPNAWRRNSPARGICHLPGRSAMQAGLRYLVLGLSTMVVLCCVAVADGPDAQLILSEVPSFVTSILVSPDAQLAVTATFNGSLSLWDIETKREVRRFLMPMPAQNATGFYSIAVSRRFDLLIGAAVGDTTVYIWSISNSSPLLKIPTGGATIGAVAFGCDNQPIVAAGESVYRINPQGQHAAEEFVGGEGDVTTIALAADCRSMAAGNRNGRLTIWKAVSPSETPVQLDLRSDKQRTVGDAITAVAYSASGRMIAAGTEAGDVFLLTSQGALIYIFHAHDSIRGLGFADNDTSLVAATEFRKAAIWDVNSHQVLRRVGSGKMECALQVAGEDAYIGTDDSVEVWSLQQLKQVGVLEGHSRSVTLVALSSDLNILGVGFGDGNVAVWDLSAGTLLSFFAAQQQTITGLAISKDSTGLLTAGSEIVEFDLDGNTIATKSMPDQLIATFAAQTTDNYHVLAASNAVSAIVGAAGTLVVDRGAQEHDSSPGSGLWESRTGDSLPNVWRQRKLLTEIEESAKAEKGVSLPEYTNTDGLFWDRTTKKSVLLKGHTGSINSVAISWDGRLGVTGSSDGTTKIWKLQPCCRELATLVSFQDGSWAVVSPDGRFDTNNFETSAGLSWVVADEPLRPLPLEVFMRDYYTPRILQQIMADRLPPAQPLQNLNRLLPKVQIVSVVPENDNPGHVNVTLAIENGTTSHAASGIQDLRLFRDGRMVRFKAGRMESGNINFQHIPLPNSASGRTVFSAYAFNSDRVKGVTTSFEYRLPDIQVKKPSQGFLVLIGVSKSQSASCDLRYAANDARAFESQLDAALRSTGHDIHKQVLVSDGSIPNGASKQAIREAIGQIATASTPDDVIVITFSGHGYSDVEGRFFLLPSDVQGACNEINRIALDTTISADELAEWLLPVDASEIVIIIDACYSAASVETRDFRPGPMGSRGLGQLAFDKKIRILAASQSYQTAAEGGELSMGFLSFALTKDGLVDGKADWKPKDGRIFMREWLGYATKRVPRLYAGQLLAADKTIRDVHVFSRRGDWALQTPALFDFNGRDDQGPVLKEIPNNDKLAGNLEKPTMLVPPASLSKAVSDPRFNLPNEGWVHSVDFSPDGKLAAAADGLVHLWAATTGAETGKFESDSGEIEVVAFSPSGRLLATGTDRGTVELWDISSKKSRTIGRHNGPVSALAFSPDGTMIVSGSDFGTASIWNVVTGKAVRHIRENVGTIWHVGFSSNGRYIATGSGGTTKVWSVANGSRVLSISATSALTCPVVFSPTRQWLLACGPGNMVTLFRLPAGSVVSTLGIKADSLRSAAFSHDGSTIATGDLDGVVQLWDAASGKEIRQLAAHTRMVEAIAFSPDGNYIVTGSLDGTARIWSLTP